jgi:hypothetical protein
MPNYSEIVCKVCNRPGGITAGKLRKFSGPVVAIGYIFLIPSVIGMLIGLVALFGTCSAAGEGTDRAQKSYESAIESIAGLTASQASQLKGAVARPDVAQLEREGFTEDVAERAKYAWDARTASQTGTGIGVGLVGGFSIFMIVGSFIGGLLGWLFTMRRKVLICGFCRGVHGELAG